jgi:hypothetical protein
MERRGYERIAVDLRAERISGDETRSILIENISETGLQILTAPAEEDSEFDPGTMIQLKLMLANGESLDLDCTVMWADKQQPDDQASSVGMKIEAAPFRYREFVQSLS